MLWTITQKKISEKIQFTLKKNLFLNKNFFNNPDEVLFRSLTMILQDFKWKILYQEVKKSDRLILLMSSQKIRQKQLLADVFLKNP